MALALVQLDPAGQQMGVAVLSRNTQTGHWQLGSSASGARPLPDAARTAKPKVTVSSVQPDTPALLGLPADTYAGTDIEYNVPPSYRVQLWAAPVQTGRVFVLAHFTGDIAQPEPGSQPLQLGAHAGWQITQDGVTAVIVPLVQQTLVVGGRATSAQMRQIAERALAQRNPSRTLRS